MEGAGNSPRGEGGGAAHNGRKDGWMDFGGRRVFCVDWMGNGRKSDGTSITIYLHVPSQNIYCYTFISVPRKHHIQHRHILSGKSFLLSGSGASSVLKNSKNV